MSLSAPHPVDSSAISYGRPSYMYMLLLSANNLPTKSFLSLTFLTSCHANYLICCFHYVIIRSIPSYLVRPSKSCLYHHLVGIFIFIFTSYIRQLLTIQPPGSTRSSSYLSLSRPPVSSSLKFCNRSFAYAAPALWSGLPKDLRHFAHCPNPALNLTYPPLALSSATFHSRLKTELF